MLIRQLFSALLIFILIGCNNSSHEPQKLKGIPLNAFWAGGPDGGNWFVTEKLDTINKSIYFKIYHDITGELMVDKNFILNCATDKSINWSNIKNLVSFFDGKKILLLNSAKTDDSCYFE